MIMPLITKPFDSAAVLDTPEAVEEYLKDAFDSQDANLIAFALGVVARAKGMSRLAQDAGLSRQALYKALSAEGNPEFATIMKVAHALGYNLAPVRAPEAV